MSWIIDASKKVQGKSIEKVTPELRRVRLDHCNSCDKLWNTGQCSLCFCMVVDKTKYKGEKCPDDPPKW